VQKYGAESRAKLNV